MLSRSLERRLKTAHIGCFKPLCDFTELAQALRPRRDRRADHARLPGRCHQRRPGRPERRRRARRRAEDALHQALIHGHTRAVHQRRPAAWRSSARRTAISALRRRLRHALGPQLLVIDEVGHLLPNCHADLMFELIPRLHRTATLVTTNRPFAEWREVFPNAACVVSLVDRLVHNAEIIAIEGESYRLKEARERADQRTRQRRGTRS